MIIIKDKNTKVVVKLIKKLFKLTRKYEKNMFDKNNHQIRHIIISAIYNDLIDLKQRIKNGLLDYDKYFK